MNPFGEVNLELESVSKRLMEAYDKASSLRDLYLVAKATYEKDMARYTLEAKAKNPDATQTDVHAEAVCLAHEARLTAIRAESAYRKVQNEIRGLTERLEALREKSFNLRKEAQL